MKKTTFCNDPLSFEDYLVYLEKEERHGKEYERLVELWFYCAITVAIVILIASVISLAILS